MQKWKRALIPIFPQSNSISFSSVGLRFLISPKIAFRRKTIMRRRQKHCTMGTMMRLLRALLVSTSYRSRGRREHFELNKAYWFPFSLQGKYFSSSRKRFSPRSFESSAEDATFDKNEELHWTARSCFNTLLHCNFDVSFYGLAFNLSWSFSLEDAFAK